MLSKDLSTRIMKQEIQLSSETDLQNIKPKIKIQKQQKKSSKVREHEILFHSRTNQAKQLESGTWIIQLPNNTPAIRRKIQSHKPAYLGSHSDLLWMDTHKTSSLL